MNESADTAHVIVRPPLALALAIAAGITLEWLVAMSFLPAEFPRRWVGGAVIALALGLFAWAIVTMLRAGANVPTNMPTTAIVESGPYGFSRNPIYVAMILFLLGLAIIFDTLWLLAALAVFALVIQIGVVVREEAYLRRKFGGVYGDYCSRVRRWL